MEYTGQIYKDLFVKTKIEGFFNKGYTGYVLALSEYFDFLLDMKGYGIERDEIEQIIIKDYLKENENE